MALAVANKTNSVRRQNKVVEQEDMSDDSDSTETGNNVRGSIDIDCGVYEYSASSSNSFDDVEDKEDNRKSDVLTDTSLQGTREEQISRALWKIDGQLATLENHIQLTSFALASTLTGWDFCRRTLIPKPSNMNIINMCNHNSSSTSGVSSQGDSYVNNSRTKNVDRVFRPASLIDAGADYSITCKDGIDPETYSYIPLNGCYAAQKTLIRETASTQKVSRKSENRILMIFNPTEETKLNVQVDVDHLRADLDFTRSQSDYMLRHDSSPRTYSYLTNEIHAIPGELCYMKDVSREYVVIPPVIESSSKFKKSQPLSSKVSTPIVNHPFVNDNQPSQIQGSSDDRSIENAFQELGNIEKPNPQNKHVPESYPLEQDRRHPPSARSLTMSSRKPLKQLGKALRFKSAPICPIQNPAFLVSPAFMEDLDTNAKNSIYSIGFDATNEPVKKSASIRGVNSRSAPVSCFDNVADNPLNNKPDGSGLPEVIGLTANAVKRPVLKPPRRSALDSHKASVMKGKTNYTLSKADLHSDRSNNHAASNNFQGPIPSIQNFSVVSSTKLNGAITINKLSH